jgi:hypothetical protein
VVQEGNQEYNAYTIPNSKKQKQTPKSRSETQLKLNTGFSALASLRKDLLPNIQPLLLLIGKRAVRVPEGRREEIAEASVENFQREHGLPVAQCEADSV